LNFGEALKATENLPENINYAVKSNYLIELLNASRTDFVFGQRSNAVPRAFTDVAAGSERAVVLIEVRN
jgi:hypothetical protein